MSKQSPEDLLRLTLLSVHDSVKFHQGLIEQWNDPQDVMQRAAEVILQIHQIYGQVAFAVLKMLENNCKHPKKMRDLCGDGTIYCMDCNADLTEEEIFNSNTPTLIKQKVKSRRKLVQKYAELNMKPGQIARKLKVSLSTIEKDLLILRT